MKTKETYYVLLIVLTTLILAACSNQNGNTPTNNSSEVLSPTDEASMSIETPELQLEEQSPDILFELLAEEAELPAIGVIEFAENREGFEIRRMRLGRELEGPGEEDLLYLEACEAVRTSWYYADILYSTPYDYLFSGQEELYEEIRATVYAPYVMENINDYPRPVELPPYKDMVLAEQNNLNDRKILVTLRHMRTNQKWPYDYRFLYDLRETGAVAPEEGNDLGRFQRSFEALLYNDYDDYYPHRLMGVSLQYEWYDLVIPLANAMGWKINATNICILSDDDFVYFCESYSMDSILYYYDYIYYQRDESGQFRIVASDISQYHRNLFDEPWRTGESTFILPEGGTIDEP